MPTVIMLQPTVHTNIVATYAKLFDDWNDKVKTEFVCSTIFVKNSYLRLNEELGIKKAV
jgi:hypothetical protein